MKALWTILLLLVLTPIGVQAQTTASRATTADDYFNEAAQHYLSDNKLDALQWLDKGLRNFPNDQRMLELAKELLKQQQQEDQQKQQQSSSDTSSDDKQNEDKQQQNQNGKDNQDKEQDQQDKQQEASDQEDTKDQEQSPSDKPADEKKDKQQPKPGEEEQEEQQTQAQPMRLSPEDAARMLEALEQEERKVQGRLQKKRFKTSKSNIEKDW